MPWYRDLELERHGAVYLEPELNVALILPDGRSLEWWTDFDKTVDSFAEFSPRDAATLRRWVEEFRPIVEQIILPEAQSPPLPPRAAARAAATLGPGAAVLEVAALSPLEFVLREFEHDVVRAGLLFFNGLREVDLRCNGFGHRIPALLAGRHKAQMCVGGSARLAEALVEDIRRARGRGPHRRRAAAHPDAAGRAVGVELADGERIEARGLRRLGAQPAADVPGAAGRATRAPATDARGRRRLPLQPARAAVRPEPRAARAAALRGRGAAAGAEPGLHGDPRPGAAGPVPRDRRGPRAGRDPADRHVGQHVRRCSTRPGPAGPAHGVHVGEAALRPARRRPQLGSRRRRPTAGRCSPSGRASPPTWPTGAVLDAFTRSPLDTERTPAEHARRRPAGRRRSPTGRSATTGPSPAPASIATPVAGLYLCGGSTHPGGNITGLCGYNAAAVLAADLGLPVVGPAAGRARLASSMT